jgi:hypothetical protein
MVQVIEHTAGRYEAQDVPFGKVYAWRSGCVVLRCDCGERSVFTGSATVCPCGADHATAVNEELAAVVGRLGDEDLRPWHYAGNGDARLRY